MDSTVIAALIAFGGVTVSVLSSTIGTYYINKNLNNANNEMQKEIANRNIDANLVAKARLKWIEEVRQLTTELISNVSMTNINGYKVIGSNKKIDEEVEFVKSFNQQLGDSDEIAIFEPEVADGFKKMIKYKLENQEKFKQNQFMVFSITENLILYFSPQEKHSSIINNVEWFKINQECFNKKIKEKQYEEAEMILHEFDHKISEFRNSMRSYLKQEWEKTKTGR